jgi:hypothetical protein
MTIKANSFETWITATDTSKVKRIGNWKPDLLRGATSEALVTHDENAAIEFHFNGNYLVLCLDTLTTPNYGEIEAGIIEVYIDGNLSEVVTPLSCADEVCLFKHSEIRNHQIRLVHRGNQGGYGCRIKGFRILSTPCGDLKFIVNGEHNFSFIDVRVKLSQNGKLIRNSLHRNWLTGQCCLAGIPIGENYEIEIIASGWQSFKSDKFKIESDKSIVLNSIYLFRAQDSSEESFKFPRYGKSKIILPGSEFRIKFKAHDAIIEKLSLVRTVGPAKISRICKFIEDKPRQGVFLDLNDESMYYVTEGKVIIPENTPTGLYDIEIELRYETINNKIISKRSVYVVKEYPKDPVFLSYGHMDVWGQGPSEYIKQIMEVANIIAPDLVLVANSCNPAYVSGAMYDLEVPFIINFGNHQSPGQDIWFGESISVMDYGPNTSILNFGHSWDRDLSEVKTILNARKNVPCKIIHAFEYGVPVEEILDPYQICLFHDAHGPGPKIKFLGKTPTIRVGKVNNSSFRLLKFKNNKPFSYTYNQHEFHPIPFPRNG